MVAGAVCGATVPRVFSLFILASASASAAAVAGLSLASAARHAAPSSLSTIALQLRQTALAFARSVVANTLAIAMAIASSRRAPCLSSSFVPNAS